MIPPANINQQANWLDVVTALGLDGVSAFALPCAMTCPICRSGRLTINNDSTYAGQWHHCRDCGSSGDMIEFAARAWGMDIHGAVKRLNKFCNSLTYVPAVVDGYVDTYVKKRLELTQIMERWSKTMPSSQHIRGLRLHLNMTNIPYADWVQRTGRFCGCATRKDVDAVIGNNAKDSIFHGHGDKSRDWKDVMVIPFTDLPGRVNGAAFYYPDDTGKPNLLTYYPLYRRATHHVDNLPGVAMIQATTKHQFDKPLFIFTDPILALRTHVKHHAVHSDDLPIVAILPELPACQYLSQVSDDLIFFSEALDAQVFRHAKALNARIVTYGGQEDLVSYLRRMRPEQWITQLTSRAKRWDTLLEQNLSENTLDYADVMIKRIGFTTAELNDFTDGSTPEIKKLLAKIQTRTAKYSGRQIVLGKKTVVETERGWLDVATGDTISSATIRISDAILYKASGKMYYRGNVMFDTVAVTFTEDADTMHRHPSEWLRKLATTNGIQPPTINSRWDKQLLDIALKFQQPVAIPGIDKYGWDPNKSAFVFSDYAMYTNGVIEIHRLPAPDGLSPPVLIRPVPILPIEQLTSDAKDVQIMWQLAIHVLYNLLAPVYNYEPQGLMVVGGSIDAVNKLTLSCGTPPQPVTLHRSTAKSSEERRQIELQQAWPTLYTGQITTNAVTQHWLRNKPHNCVLGMDWWSARAYGVEGGWMKMEEDATAVFSGTQPLLGIVVASYLADLNKRLLHRKIDKKNPCHFQWLSLDVANWLLERDGNTDVHRIFWHARNRLEEDNNLNRANYFLDVVGRLMVDGVLELQREDFQHTRIRKVRPLIGLKSKEIWIPKQTVNSLLDKMHRPELSTDAVTAALAANGDLSDMRELNGVSGWVVPEVRLEQRCSAWRESQKVMRGSRD